jgi:hypothetical protein
VPRRRFRAQGDPPHLGAVARLSPHSSFLFASPKRNLVQRTECQTRRQFFAASCPGDFSGSTSKCFLFRSSISSQIRDGNSALHVAPTDTVTPLANFDGSHQIRAAHNVLCLAAVNNGNDAERREQPCSGELAIQRMRHCCLLDQ